MAPKKQQKKRQGEKKGISKWYKPDDDLVRFKRRQNAPKPAHLRKNITPGTVLILLAGRFRGKRVVFLKQLKSGLLLVTGPHKVNGVPLKRVNQTYVIPTTTKVDLKGLNVDIDDPFFLRTKVKKVKKSDSAFFQSQPEKTEEQKKADAEKIAQKKKKQGEVDKQLLESIKAVPFLRKYLGAKFSITNTMKPHEIIF